MLEHRDGPTIKSEAALARMREAGRCVGAVLSTLGAMVAPGVTTGDLNEAAGDVIAELGGTPAFLGYSVHNKIYPANICVSVDDEIVHGIPGRCVHRGQVVPDRVLEAGSLVTIDCGVVHGGYHGDAARTLPVGEISPDKQELLDTCRDGLWAGIRAVAPGKRLTDVAAAIEGMIREREAALDRRFGLVEEYVGHGIGERLHEPPQVPNYVSNHLRRNDMVLVPGLVIAIEPMLCLGTRRTRELSDGWTVVTRDGACSAHFEHTVAVTEDGFEILTAYADEDTRQ